MRNIFWCSITAVIVLSNGVRAVETRLGVQQIHFDHKQKRLFNTQKHRVMHDHTDPYRIIRCSTYAVGMMSIFMASMYSSTNLSCDNLATFFAIHTICSPIWAYLFDTTYDYSGGNYSYIDKNSNDISYLDYEKQLQQSCYDTKVVKIDPSRDTKIQRSHDDNEILYTYHRVKYTSRPQALKAEYNTFIKRR